MAAEGNMDTISAKKKKGTGRLLHSPSGPFRLALLGEDVGRAKHKTK